LILVKEFAVKKAICTLLALFAVSQIGTAVAGDPAAENKAKTLCGGCHGPQGISTNPLWPNLAGQKDQYLAKSMQDYKAGLRNDPNMTALAQTLSDDEIVKLAAYYAALPPMP
jgi:cytochrome c553